MSLKKGPTSQNCLLQPAELGPDDPGWLRHDHVHPRPDPLGEGEGVKNSAPKISEVFGRGEVSEAAFDQTVDDWHRK